MNYKELRESLGLSKQQVVTMAQRAQKKLSLYVLTQLEEGHDVRVDPATKWWLEYIYTDDTQDSNWSGVEKGAPVFVLPVPKGTFQFKHVEDNGDICVFGGTKSQVKFRWFKPHDVRLVARQTVPEVPEEVVRTKMDVKKYMLLNEIPEQGEVTTRNLSINIGWDIPTTSRILKALVEDGKLVKVQKGVYSRR